ncbi:MAG: 4Fe-4S binding protein [Lachnospiraceae bacterium]|nr:4Fe-4S binding protein [Lachnospiraceae bacterium]
MERKVYKQTFRHVVQAAFFALTNGYVQGFVTGKIYAGGNKKICVPGLNCYSCPGALYACPIGSLQAVLNSRQFSISCYVFGFLMMVGALMGRFVCGWLCPFGMVQDLLYKIPLCRKIKNLPGHKYLTKLKYVILVVFVFLLSSLVKDITGLGQPWFCEYICPSGTLFGGIPLVILNPQLRTAIGFRFIWKVLVLLVIVLMAVKVYRPFCKYLCPLGALYGLCNPISLYRYQVDQEACVKCGACQKACDMDIKVWETPNSVECIRCGKCKNACPTHAITTTCETFSRRWKRTNKK